MNWLIRLMFGAPAKSSYQCGRDYALSELSFHGWDVQDRLLAQSDGAFNTTQREDDFDQGVRDALRDYSAQQREIVRVMRS
jgi:hypothetical protein